MRKNVANKGHGCSFDGCGRPALNKKLCSGHYAQKQRGKELTPLRTCKPRYGPVCSFEGCELPHFTKGYCNGHRQQLTRLGTVTPLRARNFWDAGKKVCPGCGVEKTEADYHKDGGHDSGYEARCKECRAKGRSPAPVMSELEVFEMIRQIEQQYASWSLTEKLRDYFDAEMKRAPRNRAEW